MEENNSEDSLQDMLAEAAEAGDCDIEYVLENLDQESIARYGAEILKLKASKLERFESGYENLQVAKTLVVTYLLEASSSAVDESILLLKEALDLSYSHTNVLKKFYKEEKNKHEKRKRSNLAGDVDYDLDSTSGRAKICRDFADIFIAKQAKLGRPVKCISGKLRMYDDGIYPDSEEAISFIRSDIIEIGLANEVNLTPGLVEQTLKLIEYACLVRTEDCEPDNDYVVVLNNGILDMRDWKFKKFDPDQVYFSKIPVDYEANAPPPTNFLRFIDTCFEGNEEQKDLIQEAFGYTLTKTYKYQDIFYILGDGGNGKGSAMRILLMMLGIENCTAFSLYQLTDGDNIDYNIAMLRGKHANICGDVGTAKVKNTENLKKLSSNTDQVTGRNVREKPFQFVNYAKLFFLMNRAPETDANTTGDKRRVRLINFRNSFSEKKGEIKDIHAVIEAAGELPGIMLWAIEGLKRLEKNKEFTDKRSSDERAEEYDRKSSTVRYFVQDRIFEDSTAVMHSGTLFKAYNEYRKEIGGAEFGTAELSKKLMEEFKEAGWVIRCQQKRISDLNEPYRTQMLEQFKKPNMSPKFFFGIRLMEEEEEDPQKDINSFTDDSIGVAHNDAEAYEMMKEKEEK